MKQSWGGWCLVCLYLSLLSGVIVGLHYNSLEPYYSTSTIEIIVPFGSWFRSLHFYSSQLFFLFAVVHYLVVFNKAESYDTKPFVLLILCFPVTLMLLFTGYVLRGDATGFSAGMIAEHILEAIPLLGVTLNNLLFSISDDGLNRVYLHHVFSFDAFFLLLAWDHLRRYRVRLSAHLMLICLLLLGCYYFAAPLDSNELGVFYITGPWFFLGLQELLRYFPPLLAGVAVPAALITSLVLLRRNSRFFTFFLYFSLTWLLLYGILSLLALKFHQ